VTPSASEIAGHLLWPCDAHLLQEIRVLMRELRLQPFGPIQMIEITTGAQRRNISQVVWIHRVLGKADSFFSGSQT
jgi:hypothetical protein